MSRFLLRRPGAATLPVTLDRRTAALVPEALAHVAKQVFEDEDDARHHLRDAAEAVRRALGEGTGRSVTVRLTAEEGAHVPEALAHVGHEVFDGNDKGRLLQAASRVVAEAFPQAPSFGR